VLKLKIETLFHSQFHSCGEALFLSKENMVAKWSPAFFNWTVWHGVKKVNKIVCK